MIFPLFEYCSFLQRLIQYDPISPTFRKQCSDLRILWLRRLWKVARIELESETSKASTEMCLDLNPSPSPLFEQKTEPLSRHRPSLMVTLHLDCHRASSLGGRYPESAFHLAKPDNSYKFQGFSSCKYVPNPRKSHRLAISASTPSPWCLSHQKFPVYLEPSTSLKKIGSCDQVTNSFQGRDIHCNSIAMLHVIQVLPFIPRVNFCWGKVVQRIATHSDLMASRDQSPAAWRNLPIPCALSCKMDQIGGGVSQRKPQQISDFGSVEVDILLVSFRHMPVFPKFLMFLHTGWWTITLKNLYCLILSVY